MYSAVQTGPNTQPGGVQVGFCKLAYHCDVPESSNTLLAGRARNDLLHRICTHIYDNNPSKRVYESNSIYRNHGNMPAPSPITHINTCQ